MADTKTAIQKFNPTQIMVAENHDAVRSGITSLLKANGANQDIINTYSDPEKMRADMETLCQPSDTSEEKKLLIIAGDGNHQSRFVAKKPINLLEDITELVKETGLPDFVDKLAILPVSTELKNVPKVTNPNEGVVTIAEALEKPLTNDSLNKAIDSFVTD